MIKGDQMGRLLFVRSRKGKCKGPPYHSLPAVPSLLPLLSVPAAAAEAKLEVSEGGIVSVTRSADVVEREGGCEARVSSL